MDPLVPTILIPASAAVGVLFAIILWQRVSKIQMTGGSVFRSGDRAYLLEEEQRGDDEVRRKTLGRKHLVLCGHGPLEARICQLQQASLCVDTPHANLSRRPGLRLASQGFALPRFGPVFSLASTCLVPTGLGGRAGTHAELA
jgi:hypothetical protein